MRPGKALPVVFAALASTVSCAAKSPASARCQTDDQCGGGLACSAGTCLPRGAPLLSWKIELAPGGSSAAAFTELANVSAPADAFDLTATPKVTVTGTISLDATAAPLTTAHVVLSVPSAIAGRPNLQFETDLAPTTATKLPTPTFTLSVPSGIVGRAGTLRLLPGAPDNATHATSTFSVTVAPMLALPVGPKALTVRGRLLSALGDPIGGLVARAFQDGNLVSNVVTTVSNDPSGSNNGTFALTVPAGGADAVNAKSLAVELEPATSDAPLPHFWAKPFALTTNVDLGDIHLPAYSQPNPFGFVFHGGTADDPPVSGAIVRAWTTLADDMTGTTDFLRDGLTDAKGQASLSLFPGSTAALLPYDIAVIPPADSIYAADCLAMFGLSTGGVLPAVVLAQRTVVTGALVGDDGTPVMGAVILATRTAPDHPTVCDQNAGTPQGTTTSNANGTFSLRLDPGTYTLDFDPPEGAPFPRLTETAVLVPRVDAGTTTTHDVKLPPGAVVEGTVRDTSGQPLPQAGLRFYAPACAAPETCVGAPPVLEAQAHANGNGHFRAIIPMPPSP
jgi:hypothetical protein